jgi:putative sigma-54 modulation protein
MKLIVSGKTKEFTPEVQAKFSLKLSKLSKLIERRGEREAHVIHHMERHLHKIEVVMHLYDHQVAVEGSNADLDNALTDAAVKLEKQVVKMRTKWRTTHRDARGVRSSKESWDKEKQPVAPLVPLKSAKPKLNGHGPKLVAKAGKPKIFRVNYDEDRKPMTIDEAVMEMESGDAYTVFRNSQANCLSVLVRRVDGNFDLIESWSILNSD